MATIKDVELVSVGTHAASTGVTKVTATDLESMLAAQTGGLVGHAPIKLGHVSALNDGIELGDGAPAYGWVTPTRIGPGAKTGAATLFGDLVGMPDLLAAAAPTAYRHRSVEIGWNVKGPDGTAYPAVIVGVALLGETPPAIKTLDDVLALFAGTPQDAGTVSTVELVEGLEANAVAVAMLTAARTAGASTSQLAAIATAAGARDTADVPPPVADTPNDETTTTTSTVPAAPAPPAERTTMTVTDEQLRKLLNIEQGADLDAAVAALLEAPAEVVDPANPAPVTAATPAPVTPAVTDPAATPEGDLVGAGVATLSAATLSELQTDAAWARSKRRQEVLDDAVRAGKISPAEVTLFAAQLETNEATTTAIIAGLAPRFAVSALGADTAGDTLTLGGHTEAAWDEFGKSITG
jgi:hypothetical protein